MKNKISKIFPRKGENDGGILLQPINVLNVFTLIISSSPTIQDVSTLEFSNFAPILLIVQDIAASEFSDSSLF